MDWQKLVTDIIIWALGLLATSGGAYLVNLIRTKVKNEKIQNILLGAVNIVQDGVDYTYQTFVENMKGTTLWDDAAKETALNKALDYAKTNLSDKAKNLITRDYGDLEVWIKNQIEVAIKKSKQQ